MKESQKNSRRIAWVLVLVGVGFLLGTLMSNRSQSVVRFNRDTMRASELNLLQKEIVGVTQAELEAVQAELEAERLGLEIELQELEQLTLEIPPIPPIPEIPAIPEISDGSTVHDTVYESLINGSRLLNNLLGAGLIILGGWLILKRNKSTEETYKAKM